MPDVKKDFSYIKWFDVFGLVYYRKDRIDIPQNNLKCIKIKPEMGWCDDPSNKIKYNKLIDINDDVHHEKIYRKDYKYDLFIG